MITGSPAYMQGFFFVLAGMKEDLLQYIWRFKKFTYSNLETTDGRSVLIHVFGDYNTFEGPDFMNAQITIDGVRWAGTVEIHVKSSDWFAHRHEKDVNYNNVILHVVWEHNLDVFNSCGQQLPVLVMKNYVDHDLLERYRLFMSAGYKFINCEKGIATVDRFVMDNWLERLFVERLQKKTMLVRALQAKTKNNWEAILFIVLMKSFGGNINGKAFVSIASSFDYDVLQKLQHDVTLTEALLFGQAGLLNKNAATRYERELYEAYQFIKSKYRLNRHGVENLSFFKLRPSNFPTIRLAQVANLYAMQPQLFQKMVNCQTVVQLQQLFSGATSAFWSGHYTFTSESKIVKRKLSMSFIDLLITNTIIPLKFCYSVYKGGNAAEELLSLAIQLPAEKNNILDNYAKIGVEISNGLHSQALLQLFHHYCKLNQCLRCALGVKLIKE